jgi:hypothetical protein
VPKSICPKCSSTWTHLAETKRQQMHYVMRWICLACRHEWTVKMTH